MTNDINWWMVAFFGLLGFVSMFGIIIMSSKIYDFVEWYKKYAKQLPLLEERLDNLEREVKNRNHMK